MKEPELYLPVTCPICMRESLAGFRISVIADAFESGEIRLYANCHVAGWDASKKELKTIVEYLDAAWAADMQKECIEVPNFDGTSDEGSCAFIFAGELEEFAAEESAGEFAGRPLRDASRDTLQSLPSDR